MSSVKSTLKKCDTFKHFSWGKICLSYNAIISQTFLFVKLVQTHSIGPSEKCIPHLKVSADPPPPEPERFFWEKKKFGT
jgi:hypothetical protein